MYQLLMKRPEKAVSRNENEQKKPGRIWEPKDEPVRDYPVKFNQNSGAKI